MGNVFENSQAIRLHIGFNKNKLTDYRKGCVQSHNFQFQIVRDTTRPRHEKSLVSKYPMSKRIKIQDVSSASKIRRSLPKNPQMTRSKDGNSLTNSPRYRLKHTMGIYRRELLEGVLCGNIEKINVTLNCGILKILNNEK